MVCSQGKNILGVIKATVNCSNKGEISRELLRWDPTHTARTDLLSGGKQVLEKPRAGKRLEKCRLTHKFEALQ